MSLNAGESLIIVMFSLFLILLVFYYPTPSEMCANKYGENFSYYTDDRYDISWCSEYSLDASGISGGIGDGFVNYQEVVTNQERIDNCECYYFRFWKDCVCNFGRMEGAN